MSTSTPATGNSVRGNDQDDHRGHAAVGTRRRSTETKAAFKTTEFIAYIVAVVGVLLASALLGGNEEASDFFNADQAWFYVTLLTIGYMVSRGLAKSGSREHYNA